MLLIMYEIFISKVKLALRKQIHHIMFDIVFWVFTDKVTDLSLCGSKSINESIINNEECSMYVLKACEINFRSDVRSDVKKKHHDNNNN